MNTPRWVRIAVTFSGIVALSAWAHAATIARPQLENAAQAQQAANKVVDGFESATKSARDPNGVNADGFAWTAGSGTPFSIVRDDGCVVLSAANKPGSACGFAERRWANAPGGRNGRHAARGNYPARSGGFAEQRFDFGVAYPDVWIRFWFRVPINYMHEKVSGSSANNKFFAIWQDGYSQKGQGSTVIWEYWPNPDGSSRLAFHYSKGDLTSAGGHQQHKEFMGPRDRGRWMQVVLRVKVESAAGAADGAVQLWRRWEDENAFTQLHDASGVPLKAGPVVGWRRGYFLGASNSWWAQQTEFLIDQVEIATVPLLAVGS